MRLVFLYISKDSPAASERVIRRIVRLARSLADNPSRGRSCDHDDGMHEIVVARTPYVIVYRLHEGIEIIAIFHGAGQWPERFE